MFGIDSLIDDVYIELQTPTADKGNVENLVKQYVIPAFNRDYPHVMTVVIRDKSRFYPYRDLTGVSDRYLNHIFLIKQDQAMYS
jgi:hypothetical protein